MTAQNVTLEYAIQGLANEDPTINNVLCGVIFSTEKSYGGPPVASTSMIPQFPPKGSNQTKKTKKKKNKRRTCQLEGWSVSLRDTVTTQSPARSSYNKNANSKIRKNLVPSDEPIANSSMIPQLAPKGSKGEAIHKPVPHVEPSSSDDTKDEERLVTGAQRKSHPIKNKQRLRKNANNKIRKNLVPSDEQVANSSRTPQFPPKGSIRTKKSKKKKNKRRTCQLEGWSVLLQDTVTTQSPARSSNHKNANNKIRKNLVPSDEPVASASRTPQLAPNEYKGKVIRKSVPHVEPSSMDITEDKERLVGVQSKSKPKKLAKSKQCPSSRSVNCGTSSSDSSDVDPEHLIQKILASASVTEKSTLKKKRRSRTSRKTSEEDIDMNKAIEIVMQNLVGSDSDDQDEKSKNEEKEVNSSETRESPIAACCKSLTKKRPKVKLYMI